MTPTYVPHGPVTAEIAAELLAAGIWDCGRPTRPTPGRVWVTWRGRTAQCQCCQGVYTTHRGRIPAHEPAEPTETRCPKCHDFYNENRDPVYMGSLSAPLCERCAMGDPIGYDDDGNPVHGAQPWLDEGVGE